jgi:uncharacterized coiled-coil protein SlyX
VITFLKDFVQITHNYGKSVEELLGNFNSRVTGAYEPEFLKQNDYLNRFLRYQRTTLLSLAEEMKSKIVASLLTTNKIIQDGSREKIGVAKKELSELELQLAERDKSCKKLDASLVEGQEILAKIKVVNTSNQAQPSKTKQLQKLEGSKIFDAEKCMEVKTKINENSGKLDEITKRFNNRCQKGCALIKEMVSDLDTDECSRRRTLITSVRNVHNMLMEGYEMFTNKSDFDQQINAIKANHLELVIPSMPISWIDHPMEEPLSENYAEAFVAKLNNDSYEKYADNVNEDRYLL